MIILNYLKNRNATVSASLRFSLFWQQKVAVTTEHANYPLIAIGLDSIARGGNLMFISRAKLYYQSAFRQINISLDLIE